MNPREVAARVFDALASLHRFVASLYELTASMARVTVSMERLSDVLRELDIDAIASHPDLMELNLQLDGYYGE